jgi:multidrug transporter EmrE-like cation transporter
VLIFIFFIGVDGMRESPWIILGLYSILLTIGQALFKVASLQTQSASSTPIGLAKQLLSTPVFVAGCLLYAISTVVWVSILNRLPLSDAYPLVIATSIILTTSLGIVFFKETLTLDKVAGLILIVAGVKIISRSLAR